MDKNAIKKFAVWARRELISRVSQKALQYGITEDSIVPATATSVNGVVLSNDEIKQRRALIEKISDKGYQHIMEEVAYTWFNRFIALRFMEVNGYLPSHVRVFTDDENNFKPQILTEAINLDLDGLNMDKVYELKEANDNEGLFKYLVIVQCNAFNPIMPRMFQKISDCTELLFPENLLREGSVIQQMIEMIPEEDWKDAVQIIGWLYQYYNSEKKDEVFAALKKNVKITKENIPAATQLFTPDWIVRYMVENSLGRIWLEGHPDDNLKTEWKYYLDEAKQEQDVVTKLEVIRSEYAAIPPEQIKCIDPCAGSGHILAYMFDVLMQIYEVYGYTAREAVENIIKNNIYGLDIDERAAQLAYFSVMMKARQYDRRFFSRKDSDGNMSVLQPNVYAIVESNGIDSYALEYFMNGHTNLKNAMDSIVKEMKDAKEYGSILNITPVDFSALYKRFAEIRDDINMNRDAVLNVIFPVVKVAEILSLKYDAVITNPPYMGNSGMSEKLSDFVKKVYPDSKTDLFAVFIERGNYMTRKNGFNCMVTMQSWMFLSSFENMRNRLLNSTTITTLMHMDNMVMHIAFGTAVTILRNVIINGYRGTYNHIKLCDINKDVPIEFPVQGNRFAQIDSSNFKKISGSPIAYWASTEYINVCESGQTVNTLASPKTGMTTGDNNRFLRLWSEVDITKCFFNATTSDEATQSNAKWFPYLKGGDFRRWYGNRDYLINWENNGYEIKTNIKPNGLKAASVRSEGLYFKPLISWSAVSSGTFACRYTDGGALFDSGGSSLYITRYRLYILALLNSKVGQYALNLTNPTINYQPGDIAGIPLKIEQTEIVEKLTSDNVNISKDDWDSFETSWDFKTHPLVAMSISGAYAWGDNEPKIRLEAAFNAWELLCQGRFNKLKENEEKLNHIFINMYGLQDELTANIDSKDITVHLADKKRDIKSLISYAVGCMFGRYSLDVSGISYAGGEWDDSRYITFKADKDSIIPISDDEYFADDIVNRFINFIEVVYGKESLQDNLRFIAEALGGSGQPQDIIRSYFLNDFYSEHCSTYSVTGSGKRPIYWLFDSGKKNGFKALVYMHRYQPDTIARMRTDYVHEQQSRYRTAIADLEQRIASATTSERVKLNKKLKTLNEQAAEIQVYEEKIHHLADQYISIDLDDGVKKNYEIFKDVLAKIK